jgi:hypothetical protein
MNNYAGSIHYAKNVSSASNCKQYYKKEREEVFVRDVALAAYTFMCPCDVS